MNLRFNFVESYDIYVVTNVKGQIYAVFYTNIHFFSVFRKVVIFYLYFLTEIG